MSETTRVRPSGVALTERQRAVLELIERGHTNFEIAQALGISLEGAKYHVREIMTKLGADSREEAVQFWRESQRSRWSLRGLFAVPWFRVAAAGGGVALVIAVALAGLTLANRDDAPGERVLVAYTTNPAEEPALVVLDGNGKEVFRAGGEYGGPRFSPDGTRLAAINIDDEARIDFFDTSNWSSTQYVPAEPPFFSIGWAPDSTLLAVVFADRVVLLDRRGQEVESTGLLVEASLESGVQEPKWAPDSARLVATVDGRLFVVSRTGDRQALEDPLGSAGQQLAAIRWNTSTELFVLDFGADRDPDRYAFLVSLEDGNAQVWIATAPHLGLSAEAERFQRQLEQRFPGLDVRLPAPTADGAGLKAMLSDKVPAGGTNELPNVRVAIEGSELVTVPLGQAIPAFAERNFDAVVIR